MEIKVERNIYSKCKSDMTWRNKYRGEAKILLYQSFWVTGWRFSVLNTNGRNMTSREECLEEVMSSEWEILNLKYQWIIQGKCQLTGGTNERERGLTPWTTSLQRMCYSDLRSISPSGITRRPFILKTAGNLTHYYFIGFLPYHW